MRDARREDPKLEIKRLEEVARDLTVILNKSRDPEHITRIQRDLENINNRYLILTGKDLEDIVKSQVLENETESETEAGPQKKYMTRIKIERASPHCEDHEINLISSIVQEFEKRYWNIISERHTKLEYSHNMERDTFFTKIEELKRNLKQIVEYIEDTFQSKSPDHAVKLRTMRAKQERQLFREYHSFFEEFRDFLERLLEDLERQGNLVLNPDDPLEFSRLDDVPIVFRGKTTREALQILFEFVDEALLAIRMPNF
jgi:hypothetical protein